MKRGTLGRMVVAEGGVSDPELEEVRLTTEEYNALWRRIKSAERGVEEARKEADKRVSIVYRDAQRQLSAYKSEVQVEADKRVEQANQSRYRAEERVIEIETEKENLEEALNQQRNLNENLKRIAKERANAKRGLVPKKERSGYLVLFSSQYRERYRNEYGEKCVANTWKTVLQTPYDATLSLVQIEDDIWEELMNHILYPMGFRRVQDVEKNGEYKSWYDGDEELCGLYRWDYKANFKTGLWEITLYHTKDLTVPEEYRVVSVR